MSDPYSPGRGMSLGDFRLRLDPDIEAQIQALQSEAPGLRLRTLVLRPDWGALHQSALDRSLLTPLPTTAARPLIPRGAGPDRPRAAEVGDLMRALWGIPALQLGATRLLDQVVDPVRREWRRASGGEQALFVSWSVVIAGAALAGMLSNNEARTAALGAIAGLNIPVPRVNGLTVRLQPRGAAATYRNIGGSGLTIGGGAQAGPGRAEYEVMLTLDVTRYVRKW